MEAHPFVCPASRCTYGSTGHVTKAYVSDSNQFKIYIESEVCIFWVYGDFSATLYNLLHTRFESGTSTLAFYFFLTA